jgi:hypothetical protein
MVKISTKLIGLDCCASMMVLNSIDHTILTKENLFSISNDGPIRLLLPNNEGSKSQKLHSHNMGLVLFILSFFWLMYAINKYFKHCFKGKFKPF